MVFVESSVKVGIVAETVTVAFEAYAACQEIAASEKGMKVIVLAAMSLQARLA